MAVQVNPIVARKGHFMQSFEDTDQMFAFIDAAENALQGNKITGQRIVYTKIPQWSGPRRFDMLQVYVIPAGLVADEKVSPKYKVKRKLFYFTLRKLRQELTHRADRLIFSQLTAARLIGGVHTADRLGNPDHFLRGFQLDFHVTDRFPVITACFPPVLEKNPPVTSGFPAFVTQHHAFHIEHDRGRLIIHPDKIIHDTFQLRPVQVACLSVGDGRITSVACYDLCGTLPGDLVHVSYTLNGCAFRVKLVHGTVAGFKFLAHKPPERI